MLVEFQVKTRGEDPPNEPGSFFNGYRYQAMVFVGNVAELVQVGERDENAFIVERPGVVGACESLCDAAFLYLSSQDSASVTACVDETPDLAISIACEQNRQANPQIGRASCRARVCQYV